MCRKCARDGALTWSLRTYAAAPLSRRTPTRDEGGGALRVRTRPQWTLRTQGGPRALPRNRMRRRETGQGLQGARRQVRHGQKHVQHRVEAWQHRLPVPHVRSGSHVGSVCRMLPWRPARRPRLPPRAHQRRLLRLWRSDCVALIRLLQAPRAEARRRWQSALQATSSARAACQYGRDARRRVRAPPIRVRECLPSHHKRRGAARRWRRRRASALHYRSASRGGCSGLGIGTHGARGGSSVSRRESSIERQPRISSGELSESRHSAACARGTAGRRRDGREGAAAERRRCQLLRRLRIRHDGAALGVAGPATLPAR